MRDRLLSRLGAMLIVMAFTVIITACALMLHGCAEHRSAMDAGGQCRDVAELVDQRRDLGCTDIVARGPVLHATCATGVFAAVTCDEFAAAIATCAQCGGDE